MLPAGLCAATRDLLQLDPHRPAAQRGERGLAVAVGEGRRRRPGRAAPSRAAGRRGVRGGCRVHRVRGSGGLSGAGLVGDLAAFGAQFGDPLLEQVEQLLDRNRAGGQLEEGRAPGAWPRRPRRRRPVRARRVPGRRATRRRRGRPSRAARRCRRGPRRAAASRGARCRRAPRRVRRGGRCPSRRGPERCSGPVPRRRVRRWRRRAWPCRRWWRRRGRGRARHRPSGRRGPRRPVGCGPFRPVRRGRVCPRAAGARGAVGAAGSQLWGRRPGVAVGRVGAWSRAGYGTSRVQSSG